MQDDGNSLLVRLAQESAQLGARALIAETVNNDAVDYDLDISFVEENVIETKVKIGFIIKRRVDNWDGRGKEECTMAGEW